MVINKNILFSNFGQFIEVFVYLCSYLYRENGYIMIDRLSSTDQTNKLVEELVEIHGPLVFHQSGGVVMGLLQCVFQEMNLGLVQEIYF